MPRGALSAPLLPTPGEPAGPTCGGADDDTAKYRGSKNGAAYIFSIFGQCSSRHQAQLFASAQLLQRTSPHYPLAAMLSPSCWRNGTFRALLQAESITPLCVPRIANVSCHGARQRGSFFDEHWTKLNLLNLTGLRVALYLDSDVVVRRSLDAVVRQMIHRPEYKEARTPQGCLDKMASYTWFNTGIWAVRPNASDFERLVAWMQRGGSACFDGDQSAAMGFWRMGGPGGRRAHEVMPLHVGFNMKADQGPETCLRKHNLSAADLHVVHFSGKQKPFVDRKGADSTWRSAREQYLGVFDAWATTLGVPGCSARQQFSDRGCYSRL